MNTNTLNLIEEKVTEDIQGYTSSKFVHFIEIYKNNNKIKIPCANEKVANQIIKRYENRP